MSFSLLTIIIFSTIIVLFLAALHFLVEGGLKNYLILFYFLLAALIVSICLSQIIIVSDTKTYQYDLNDCVKIEKIKNDNKEHYYQLIFNSNSQKEIIKAKEIIWIFCKHDTDLNFDNIVKYEEIKYRILGTNIYLKKDKEYKKFTLFIQKPKEITCI